MAEHNELGQRDGVRRNSLSGGPRPVAVRLRPKMDTCRQSRTGESTSTLKMYVDVNVDDAVRKLKIVQREARKTIQLLREVENAAKTRADAQRGLRRNEEGMS